MRFLYNVEYLRALRFKSSYAFLKHTLDYNLQTEVLTQNWTKFARGTKTTKAFILLELVWNIKAVFRLTGYDFLYPKLSPKKIWLWIIQYFEMHSRERFISLIHIVKIIMYSIIPISACSTFLNKCLSVKNKIRLKIFSHHFQGGLNVLIALKYVWGLYFFPAKLVFKKS